jgi:hypothetical protein
MSAPESIIDKVRKLLALSHGTPNEGEAETAMAIAQRLLLEHGLTLADAAAAGDAGFTLESIWRGDRKPPENSIVWGLVEKFFFCFPIYVGNQLFLLGRGEHVAIGRYVGVFLGRTFRALWSVYRSERGAPRSQQREYYLGLAVGVSERLSADRLSLAAARPELGALITSHAADLAAEVARRFGGALAPRREVSVGINSGAFDAGRDRGRKISIRTSVSAPKPQPRLTAEERR